MPHVGRTSNTDTAALGSAVYVIDDEEPIRDALAALFQSARVRVETYPDAISFLEMLPSLSAGHACVLADVRMPGMDGIELLLELRKREVRLPVVVMTGHGDVKTAVQAMKAGAIDFFEKPFDGTTILGAVQAALSASTALSTAGQMGNNHILANATQAVEQIAALTPRERQVLDLLAEGKPNKAIAYELGLSPRTVEACRARMMSRLGVRSLSEAVRLWVWSELATATGSSGLEC
jgi:two-component system response regulator FixJ